MVAQEENPYGSYLISSIVLDLIMFEFLLVDLVDLTLVDLLTFN